MKKLKPKAPTAQELFNALESEHADADCIVPIFPAKDLMEVILAWAMGVSPNASESELTARCTSFECGLETGMRIMHARSNPK
jgi:hypothetical protein